MSFFDFLMCAPCRRRKGYSVAVDAGNVGISDNPGTTSDVLSARFYLRGSDKYSLKENMLRIGCRPNKSHLLIVHGSDSSELLLQTVPASALVSAAEREAFQDMLDSLRHPFVLPTLDVDFLDEKSVALVVRRFNGKGSLRDFIYKTNPRQSYHNKYTVVGVPLEILDIQRFGKQILKGLLYLRKRGFPYFHLHTANVILENKVCRLTDYENALLELPPLLHGFMIPGRSGRREAQGVTDPDVLCFGYVLFEMAAGFEADSAITPDTIPANVAPAIADVLRLIFAPDRRDVRIEDVLQHPFFERVDPYPRGATAPDSVTEFTGTAGELCKRIGSKMRGVYAVDCTYARTRRAKSKNDKKGRSKAARRSRRGEVELSSGRAKKGAAGPSPQRSRGSRRSSEHVSRESSPKVKDSTPSSDNVPQMHPGEDDKAAVSSSASEDSDRDLF